MAATQDRPTGPTRFTGADTPQDKLIAAMQGGYRPTDATLAYLMRFAQWALDEAADGLLARRTTPERLRELADGLEALGNVIRAHTLR